MEDKEKNNGNEEVVDNGAANNNNGTDNTNNDNNGNSNNGGKTFTQAEVTAMMAREKHQGANSVYNALGIDPKDTKTINMFKAFVASQKTDEQKAQEQQTQQTNALLAAERKATIAEAKAEAMMAGVQKQFVDDVITLAMAKMDSSDGADLNTILGELKTKYPVWFGQTSDEDDKQTETKKKTVGQRGTGNTVKTTSKDKNNNEQNLGTRLAAQRRKSSGKKSLWS